MRVAFWFWHLAVDSFELFFLRACWRQHREISYKIKLLYFSRAPQLRKFGLFNMHPRNLCSDRIFCRYVNLPLHVSRSKKSTTLNPMRTNWLNWCWTAMSWPLDSCQNRVTADQCHMTVSQAQVYNSSKWCVLFRLLHWLFMVLKSSQARKT